MAQNNYPRPDPELVDFFKKVPTAFVSDAEKKVGLRAENLYIRGVMPEVPIETRGAGDASLCGPAVTFTMGPHTEVRPYSVAPYDMGTRIHFLIVEEYAQPGDIVVIGTSGGVDWAVWGGYMSQRATKLGVAAVVMDGKARDVEQARQYKLPIFSTGRTMISYVYYLDPIREMGPTECGGALVRPGDLIVADEDGVCIVPLEAAELVKQSVDVQIVAERKIQEHLDAGGSFKEIYEVHHPAKYVPQQGE